ncbi:MAG: putative Ig domain-containing protein, partial [Ilumatobacteraceae bacterium]
VWSAASLPDGLNISSTDGVISGAPTTAATYKNSTVTVTDASGATSTVSLAAVTVTPALVISGPATLPVGQSGVAYPSTLVTSTGGTAPYTWAVAGLPAGVTFDATTLTISGTPTVSGPFSVVVTVSDAMTSVTTTYPITITPALAVSAPTSLPAGEVGVVYPSTVVAAAGGTSPYTWTVTGLPAGVTFNTTSLTIAGTPTTAGTVTIVATVTDQVISATRSYTVTIAPVLVAAWPVLPSGQVAVAYPATGMAASGGTLPYTWTVTGLPTGLVMNAAGAISGTPSAAGTYATKVTLVDAMGATTNRTYSVVVAATAAVCPGTVTGWQGEYYSNTTLTAPVTLCRDDPNPINFNWAGGGPDPSLPVDNFSVRWTRTQTFAAGYYAFTVGSDDGSRLYIDDVLLSSASNWSGKSYSTLMGSVFVADGNHTIVMEYYEQGGDARATLTWVAVGPPACSVAATGWLGQYFSNPTLTGLPAECRDDLDPINFNWSNGAPITGIAADNFSVRWTRTQTFAAGTYKFALGTDDGGRLFIDDAAVPLIDRWVDQGYPTPQPSATTTLSAGPHKLVVEYYEKGGSAQATLVVTTANPPAAPTLAFSAFANTFWSGTGSIVYYRPAATSGSFTVTASATDTAYGITSYAFPALGTNWTSTAGSALGVNTYAWTGAPAVPVTPAVTATNGAGLTSTGTPFTLTIDSTIPSNGSVTYLNGTTTTTAVSVSFTTGTDAGSGVATRVLQRASAPLTGSTCGTYGAYATLANGTNPTSPVADTVALVNCYKYRYVVADNVGNVRTTVGASVVKARKPYFNTVDETAGLLSYWRLGEATTVVSSDTFTGTTGVTLQSRAGELGSTWTKAGVSNADAVLTSGGRIRKSGASTIALYGASAVPAGANYAVEADVYVASALTNDVIGVVGRFDSSLTFYAAVYDLPTKTWTIEKVVNGSQSPMNRTAVTPLTVGATYRLTLDMNGSTISLLVNGVQQVSIVDATITAAGRGGVVLGGGTTNTTTSDSTGMQLDNFRVWRATSTIADGQGVNNGTYSNGPTLGMAGALTASGDSNTAVQFDGSSEYGTVANQVSGDLSIEFWFNSTAGGVGTSSNFWQAAGMVDAEVNGSGDFGVALRSDGKVIAGDGAPADVSIISTAGYKDGSWHHVVFSRASTSGALVLYVDGAQVAAATGGTGTLSAASISFGRTQTGTQYFAGALDEVAIYNTVLPATTVAAHYNAAK